MSVTSFRLIIVHNSAEPLQVFLSAQRVLDQAAREAGASIEVTLNERPKFVLVGDFPEGAAVVDAPGA